MSRVVPGSSADLSPRMGGGSAEIEAGERRAIGILLFYRRSEADTPRCWWRNGFGRSVNLRYLLATGRGTRPQGGEGSQIAHF